MRLRVVGHLKVLARAGLIDIWDDRRLEGGDDWLAEINEAMGRARIALLLISAPFLTSDFILKKEIPRLFKRHEAEGMTIYPLLIRYCSWEQVRWLKRMQVRPEDGRPVSDFNGSKKDKVLTEVAREIAKIAKQAARKSRTRKTGTVRAASGKVSPRAAKKPGRARKARTRVSGKESTAGRKRIQRPLSRRAKPK